jgi:hypothetical protein
MPTFLSFPFHIQVIIICLLAIRHFVTLCFVRYMAACAGDPETGLQLSIYNKSSNEIKL